MTNAAIRLGVEMSRVKKRLEQHKYGSSSQSLLTCMRIENLLHQGERAIYGGDAFEMDRVTAALKEIE